MSPCKRRCARARAVAKRVPRHGLGQRFLDERAIWLPMQIGRAQHPLTLRLWLPNVWSLWALAPVSDPGTASLFAFGFPTSGRFVQALLPIQRRVVAVLGQ